MQHLDPKYPVTPYQALSQTSAAQAGQNFSQLLRAHLTKSWLLAGVLLCAAVKPSAAQTGCTLQLTTAVTNAECGALGTINLTVAGGTGPYAYAWTGANGFTASTEDLSTLPAGTYSVTVTDNTTRCVATASATVAAIADTTPPTLRAAGLDVTLVNGTYTVFAADIDYGSFDNCSSVVSMRISPSTFTCANVGPNPVTFTATDNAGNSASTVVTIVVSADATCQPLAAATATAATQLLQVYPNPATSTATVAFVAEKTGAAQVVVFNSLGQQVASLYDGAVRAGQEYRFALQSTKLAPGVYTCQVRTAGHSYTTRLLIAR
jgi:hypothetical protein